MIALLLLAATAQAQETCSERIGPEVLGERVQAITEQVARGDRNLGQELNQLFRTASECVDGPVEKRDLGALLLARGAFGLLSGTADAGAAREQMTWAYAIAGRDVFDEIYGIEVLEAFDSATTGVLPKAFLSLSFARDPRVVVVDGEVVYDRSKRMVTATFHLIQWLDSKGWHSQRVILSEGDEVTVGGGEGQTARAEAEATVTGRIRVQSERKRKRTKRKRTPLEGPRLHLALSGSYGLHLARYTHDLGASTGGLVLPAGRASVRYDLGKRWGLYTQGGLGPGLIDASYPSLLSHTAAGLSFGARGHEPGWNLDLGGGARPIASSAGVGPENGEAFSLSPDFGGNVRLVFRQPSLQLELSADILLEAFALRFEGTFRLPEIGKTQLKPTAGIALGFMQSQIQAELPDQAFGFQACAGLLRSF